MAIPQGHYVGYMNEIDNAFLTELRNTLPHLHLYNLPFNWFEFIFWGKPHEEVQTKLEIIHTQLQIAVNESKVPVCPDLADIWNWTVVGSPQDVKVVILGQDPYHSYTENPNTRSVVRASNGYGFGVNARYFAQECRNKLIPYSLNIITGMVCGPEENYMREGNGSLISWYQQGVLMLDLSLTTMGHKPNAHKNIGWDYVTKLVIARLGAASEPRKVFMFWGAHFKKMFSNVVNQPPHYTIFCCHPASVRWGKCTDGCWSNPDVNCFMLANKYLAEIHANTFSVNWNPLCKFQNINNDTNDR